MAGCVTDSGGAGPDLGLGSIGKGLDQSLGAGAPGTDEFVKHELAGRGL